VMARCAARGCDGLRLDDLGDGHRCAVLGGLVVAWRGTTGVRTLTLIVIAFGGTFALAALAPSLPLELVALAMLGWASISFMATGNSTLQLTAEPSMRGRVMSLWFVAFQGSTPIGGPLIGWIIAAAGARAGLGTGAAVCVLAAALGLLGLRRAAIRATASAAA